MSETDPTGLRTRYTYNGSHYLASVIASDGALNLTTSFGYDAAGNVTSLTDPRGNSHTAAYDRNRRIAEWDAPLGAVTHWTYDPTGLLLTLKRATGNGGAPWATTGFTYWPTGKVHTSTDPDGSVTVTEHDALGRTSKVTDPMGRAVSTTYDLIGEVLQERHAAGTASEIVYATHTWSPDGKELSVADANGNLTAYAYDGFDRMARQTYPSPTTAGLSNPADYESFVYDANGNVTGHRIRGGVTITSTYDALDRLIRRLVPAFGAQGADVTTATAYDRAGRETAVSDTLGNTIVSTYDTAGRLSATTRTTPALAARTVSYQYDAASNRTRLTWPDGYYVQYAFDALKPHEHGERERRHDARHYGYDPLSRRTGLAYGNGTAITYGYTAGGDLASLVHDLAGTSNDATTTLTHNLAHQLSGESVTNPAWRLASPATGSTTYVPNGLNQYASVGGSGLTYDADGNLATDGSWTYGYDGENRLLVAKTAGTLAVYAYDPARPAHDQGHHYPRGALVGHCRLGRLYLDRRRHHDHQLPPRRRQRDRRVRRRRRAHPPLRARAGRRPAHRHGRGGGDAHLCPCQPPGQRGHDVQRVGRAGRGTLRLRCLRHLHDGGRQSLRGADDRDHAVQIYRPLSRCRDRALLLPRPILLVRTRTLPPDRSGGV